MTLITSFYRNVAEEVGKYKNYRLIAILPQPVNETKNYLKDLGIFVNEIKQAPLSTINVKVTPTVLIVNNTGAIEASWAGKLSSDQEQQFFNELYRGGVERITAAELKSYVETGQAIVFLSINERDDFARAHIEGAKNIPLDEVEVRSLNELDVIGNNDSQVPRRHD